MSEHHEGEERDRFDVESEPTGDRAAFPEPGRPEQHEEEGDIARAAEKVRREERETERKKHV